jgi:broad specificity phosphatase PhoE
MIAVRIMNNEPLHILLVRHGQTDANRDGIAQGQLPTSLNAVGRRQARLVAKRLATFAPEIELIISSDLPRAAQTADTIADGLGLTVQCDRAWRERTLGVFEGKTATERAALRVTLSLGAADPPGAQSEADYQAGIKRALCRIPAVAEQHGARCVCIVSHYGACRAITMMLADGRLPAAPGNPVPSDFIPPNCAVTHLIRTVTPSGPQYRYACECVYDVEHLEPMRQAKLKPKPVAAVVDAS